MPAVVVNDITGTSGDLLPRVESAGQAALASGVVPEALLRQAEISITLVGRDRIRELNRVYHGVNVATDVLAFSLESGPPPNDVHASDSPAFLGDVYVCPEVARGAAVKLGIHPSEELLRLVIHGVLHLLGHDHPDGEGRYESEMFRIQERILTNLSLSE